MSNSIHDQLLDLLRGSEVLTSLPENELRDLATRVHRNRYEANQLIFRKKDASTGMMAVVSGRVKITSVGISGSEVILNIIDPGQVFGEMALIDEAPRSADAVAATQTEVLSIMRRDFLPILKRNPEACLTMMTLLVRRVRKATSFVEDAVFLDVPTRLLHRLESLAEQYGKADPRTGAVRIEHGLTQEGLGHSCGLTRVSVNRQLSAWRDAGMIEDGRGWTTILDPARLEEWVRG